MEQIDLHHHFLQLNLGRALGVVVAQGPQDDAVEGSLGKGKIAGVELSRQIATQRLFVVLLLSSDEIKQSQILAQVAPFILLTMQFEVAFLGLTHGLNQLKQRIGLGHRRVGSSRASFEGSEKIDGFLRHDQDA